MADYLKHLGQLLLWHVGGQERQQRQGGVPDETVVRAQHAGHGGLKADRAAEKALSIIGEQGAQRTQRQLKSIRAFSAPAQTMQIIMGVNFGDQPCLGAAQHSDKDGSTPAGGWQEQNCRRELPGSAMHGWALCL